MRLSLFLTALVALILVATAGCTAEQTHYADGERSDLVEILHCDTYYVGSTSVGEITLKNIHDESLSSVEVLARFYGDAARVGEERKTVRDLGPGETARIMIPYRGFADSVEVDEIRIIV